VSASYASGIARLNAAGIKVLGYVATGYATKMAAVIKADMDSWKAFYPGQLGGIFFDEQSNRAGDVAFYRDLSQYAKAQGLSFTVGNPGTDTAESYIGALDAMLIYESAGLPSASQLGGWHANYAPSNFGVIPYAVAMDPNFIRNARQHVQYIYLQNDSLPNPWDSLPGYFSDLLAALE
jgi:Spherulation-specific family 4